MIAGGGAPEIELAIRLSEYSNTLSGMEQYCVKAFADALEVIPYTLAENAGLNPIATVTELRNKHARGETTAGINVRKGIITDILEENVVQPLLVSTSAITLASETVRSILKIDDIVSVLFEHTYIYIFDDDLFIIFYFILFVDTNQLEARWKRISELTVSYLVFVWDSCFFLLFRDHLSFFSDKLLASTSFATFTYNLHQKLNQQLN